MTTSKLFLNLDDPNVISHLNAISETHKIQSVAPKTIDVPEHCKRGINPLSHFSCCLDSEINCDKNVLKDPKSLNKMKNVSESLEKNYSILNENGEVTLKGNVISVCRMNDTYHASHDKNSKDFVNWMSQQKTSEDIKMECGKIMLTEVFPTTTIFKNVTDLVDITTFMIDEKEEEETEEKLQSEEVFKSHNVLEVVVTKS